LASISIAPRMAASALTKRSLGGAPPPQAGSSALKARRLAPHRICIALVIRAS
jgi:hypothetical protein